MKTEKLELKHLAGYLPYGLKFVSELDKPYDEYGKQPIWTCSGITMLFGDNFLNNIETNDAYPMHLCKPILRPLSYLTKEIEVNGEKFVPIEILSEELEGITFGKTSDFYDNLKRLMFHFYDRNEVEINIEDCLFLISKLYEWHFDIYGLIENNLAIDINTLKP